MSQSGSDVDAEGSEDADYAQIPAVSAVRDITIDPPTPESSSSIGNKGKRKHDADGLDYMRQDPELYGLRRSVRSHLMIGLFFISLTSITGSCPHQSSSCMLLISFLRFKLISIQVESDDSDGSDSDVKPRTKKPRVQLSARTPSGKLKISSLPLLHV